MNIMTATDVLPIEAGDDNNDLSSPVRALRANTAGTIKIKALNGQTRTLNFLAGETRTVGALKVFATGTTCTGIEGSV